MAEQFLIRTNGGPHPGTRVAEGVEWPLPETLPDEGGVYRKTNESQLPPLDAESHLMRGAEYEWEEAPWREQGAALLRAHGLPLAAEELERELRAEGRKVA